MIGCEDFNAEWCPNCGDCECGWMPAAVEACPLHGIESKHAEDPTEEEYAEAVDDLDAMEKELMSL